MVMSDLHNGSRESVQWFYGIGEIIPWSPYSQSMESIQWFLGICNEKKIKWGMFNYSMKLVQSFHGICLMVPRKISNVVLNLLCSRCACRPNIPRTKESFEKCQQFHAENPDSIRSESFPMTLQRLRLLHAIHHRMSRKVMTSHD